MRADWMTILDEARFAPSPHNSQPMRVMLTGDETAVVFYDLDRGLPAEAFGIPFGHVAAGVFLECLEVVARAHGAQPELELHLDHLDFDAADRLHPIATVRLRPHEPTDHDHARRRAYLARQTNRRPYDASPIAHDTIARVERTIAERGQRFGWTQDRALVEDVIRINQETLFRDLQNDAVHAEILAWIRTSKAHAQATGDGLSAETMLLPGRVLGAAMRHRELWQAPVLGALLRGVYLRTMRGVRQLGWIQGPFAGPADYLAGGRAFLAAWLDLTEAGVWLHPLGTVVTNPVSHAAFVERAGIIEADGERAWMLFRFGHAPTPPVALRRSVESMLVRA